jgi:essential nuclear protein 1
MGKSKKKNKISASFSSSQGLEDQINHGRVAKPKNKKFDNLKLRHDEENEYIDPRTTQRILNAAQKQRAELAKEFGPTPSEAKSKGFYDSSKQTKFAGSEDDESDVDEGDKDEYTEHDFFDDLKINDEDERALQMFQNT